jgi:hypothetical protein
MWNKSLLVQKKIFYITLNFTIVCIDKTNHKNFTHIYFKFIFVTKFYLNTSNNIKVSGGFKVGAQRTRIVDVQKRRW